MKKLTSVYACNEQEFHDQLDLLEINPTDMFVNAPNIYEFLTDIFQQNCMDSTLREYAFTWWTKKTNQQYHVIYNKWLN